MIRELGRYKDDVGRRCRFAFTRDAWVRQEFREGVWVTIERHPVQEWETNSIPQEAIASAD